MKSKHYVILVFLVIFIPNSLSVVAVEPRYWPVAEGEVLYFEILDDISEAYGNLNLTIDTIHTNGIIDFHTDVDGTPEIAAYHGVWSTSDSLTLKLNNIIFLYSTDEFLKIDWKEQFQKAQEYWEGQSLLFDFWGKKFINNRYRYVVTIKGTNELYRLYDIEYSNDGILNHYEYGEIGPYNEDWGHYENYKVEWSREVDRGVPIINYVVFSATIAGLGAIATWLCVLWRKDRKRRKHNLGM